MNFKTYTRPSASGTRTNDASPGNRIKSYREARTASAINTYAPTEQESTSHLNDSVPRLPIYPKQMLQPIVTRYDREQAFGRRGLDGVGPLLAQRATSFEAHYGT